MTKLITNYLFPISHQPFNKITVQSAKSVVGAYPVFRKKMLVFSNSMGWHGPIMPLTGYKQAPYNDRQNCYPNDRGQVLLYIKMSVL